MSIDSYSKLSSNAEEEEKLSSSGTKSTTNGSPDDKTLMETIFKKYALKNGVEAHKKYLELKQERRELRTKLDEFQKTFELTHNRKIKYTKDVAPVSHEFKRYKDLKSDLMKLEKVLNIQAK